MRQCANCGALLDDDAVFCTECGTKLGPQKKTCPSCGAEIGGESLFCSVCGQRIDAIPTPSADLPQEENNIPSYEEPATEEVISEKVDSNDKYKLLVYVIGGIVCILLLVWGGHAIYNRYLENQLDFVTPLKYIRVTDAVLYSEPNEYASLAKSRDGSPLNFLQGQGGAVIEDCGDWYKVVFGGDNVEGYVKKDKCEDIHYKSSINKNATYLIVNCKTLNLGSAYIVHRTDGRQLVLIHNIAPTGKESISLGKYSEGHYIFNYQTEIDNQYWGQYRKTILTDGGNVSLIDFNKIPEDQLTEPFKDFSKKKERIHFVLDDLYLELIRFTNLDISTISNFYQADHPYLEGIIAGKYDFVMLLDIIGDIVKGRYRVLQNQDGFVNLSGNITPSREIEIHEYKPDGTPTGYYFRGTLKGKEFSGKYLSTERQLKMKFTSHFE